MRWVVLESHSVLEVGPVSVIRLGKKTVSVQLRRGDMTPEEDAFFLERRKEYCDAVRELWQLGKSILTGSRDSLYHSKQLEFKI